MIRYGKKKHFGFWCTCKWCDPDYDERMTMKKRARQEAKDLANEGFNAWLAMLPDDDWKAPD